MTRPRTLVLVILFAVALVFTVVFAADTDIAGNDDFAADRRRQLVESVRSTMGGLVRASQQAVALGDRLTAIRAQLIAARDDADTPIEVKRRLQATIVKLNAIAANVPAFYTAAKSFRDAEQNNW